MTKKFNPSDFRLKYRREDQINESFCRTGPHKKLSLSSLVLGNFEHLRKVLLNHVECVEI